jgi:hypothetical protein
MVMMMMTAMVMKVVAVERGGCLNEHFCKSPYCCQLAYSRL